jgi:hypothetical protein
VRPSLWRANTLHAIRASFVGERNCQRVVVQPFLGRLDPRLKPIAFPTLGPDQYDPCCLDEEPIVVIRLSGSS